MVTYKHTDEEENVLFNDALNTFLFTVIWCRDLWLIENVA